MDWYNQPVVRRDSEKHSALLWLILAVCLIVRILYLLRTGLNAELTGDAGCYVKAAECITRGVYPPDFPITRPPLYPLLISAFWGLGTAAMPAVRVFQAILDTLGCLVLATICRRLFGSRAANLAAAAYALNPYFVFDVATVQTETLYQFLILLGCLLYLRLWQSGRSGALAFAVGIVVGLSALTRPQSLVLLAALVVLTAWRMRPAGFRAAGLILAGAVVTIGPWTARNAVAYGEFIPVTDGAGYTFWLGNNRALLEKFRAKDYDEFLRIDRRVYFEDTDALVGPVLHVTPRVRDAFWFRQGTAAIRELGSEYPILLAYKIAVFFRPTVSPQAYGWKRALLLLFFPGTLFLIGFVVFFYELFRWDSPAAPLMIFTLCCFLTGLALAVLFQSQLRFRVPLLDPWLIALATWKLTQRKNPSSAESASAAG